VAADLGTVELRSGMGRSRERRVLRAGSRPTDRARPRSLGLARSCEGVDDPRLLWCCPLVLEREQRSGIWPPFEDDARSRRDHREPSTPAGRIGRVRKLRRASEVCATIRCAPRSGVGADAARVDWLPRYRRLRGPLGVAHGFSHAARSPRVRGRHSRHSHRARGLLRIRPLRAGRGAVRRRLGLRWGAHLLATQRRRLRVTGSGCIFADVDAARAIVR